MKNKNFLLSIIAIILAGIFIILVLVPRPEPEIVFVPTTPLPETQETQEETLPSTPAPTPTPSPIPSPTPIPPQNDECALVTGYSCDAYKNAWISAFKAENNLTDALFNSYISIKSTDFNTFGTNYEYIVDYTITKSWVIVQREDQFLLYNATRTHLATPSEWPLERSIEVSGRQGLSTINLNDAFAFSNSLSAVDYYVNHYGLSGTNPSIFKFDFQYFWDKENAESHNEPFAGEGGEAYIRVFGTIDSSQNKCYTGQLGLVSKEMTYTETVCAMS